MGILAIVVMAMALLVLILLLVTRPKRQAPTVRILEQMEKESQEDQARLERFRKYRARMLSEP